MSNDMMTQVLFLITVVMLFVPASTQGNVEGCADGYTCFDDGEGTIWAMKNNGSPSCASVCANALISFVESDNVSYGCQPNQEVHKNATAFESVADGLGFTCKAPVCWGGEAPGIGLTLVSRESATEKTCYFATERLHQCTTNPGNANCYGERYNTICPCLPEDQIEEIPSILPKGNVAGCAEGYTCYDDGSGIIWTMKNDGNTNGPSCDNVCQTALCGTGEFHVCHRDQATHTEENFPSVARGLGFECVAGGCFDGEAPGEGLTLVSNTAITIEGVDQRTCYYSTEETHSCTTDPGNANCFNERYSSICPCVPKPLDEACTWDSPPHRPSLATWPTTEPDEMTTCIDRINYWRKVACDEGWAECPPCGLPPMVECINCHECANSQSEYDKEHSAHASFDRCVGAGAQGQGGGANCASVIDAFVSERGNFNDSRCTGHCGPIVKHGCQTFHWGKAQTSNFHTLNWRSCNVEQCEGYCENPTENECFRLDDNLSPAPFQIESENISTFILYSSAVLLVLL